MDLHAQQIMGFFDIPVDHLYAAPVMYRYFQQEEAEGPGGRIARRRRREDGARVREPVSGAAGDRQQEAQIARRKSRCSASIGDVDGKNVLLVDDLTETAGTVTRAAEILKKHGAKKVYASVSHAVLNPAALDRLEGVGVGGVGHDGHGAALEGQRVQADGVDGRAVAGRGDQADP